MNTLNPIFTNEDIQWCSVPVPPINDHKGATFDFTEQQIANYGQSQTHPSILYIPEGFNGHKYWLATTPYPKATGVFENPCIYYGDEDGDGNPPVVFNAISGGVATAEYPIINNPVVKLPSNAWTNSDPDLCFDGTKLVLISRCNSTGHSCHSQYSEDGLAWSERSETVLYDDTTIGIELLSPALLYLNGGFQVYALTGTVGIWDLEPSENGGYCYGLRKLVGDVLGNSELTYNARGVILGTLNIDAWHMDIFMYDSKYYMICCARNYNSDQVGMKLYLAVSEDGHKWFMYSRPLHDGLNHYRPTACVKDNELIVYFSVTTAPSAPADYPNGSSDVPVDGRAIGLLHGNFDVILNTMNNDKVYGWE